MYHVLFILLYNSPSYGYACNGHRQMLKHVGASLSYNKCISCMCKTDLLTTWIQMNSS